MRMVFLNVGTTGWETQGEGLEAIEDSVAQEGGEVATIFRPKILSAPLVSVAMETISTSFLDFASLTEYS